MNARGENLLVVDDNEMNRDMLSRRLARRGFRVEVAEDGYKALDLINDRPFDLILLDIMMPGIDGFEVLETLRKTHSPSDLPIIMATAEDGSEEIVRALKLGANDYVTKPLDFPVVIARVNTQLDLKKSKDELASAHARMKRDLDAAAAMQRDLLPQNLPEEMGARFAWHFEPCDELGGDILNVVPLNDRSVAMYLLDVTGHGVPAALLSVTLSSVLTTRDPSSSILVTPNANTGVPAIRPPGKVAAHLNRQFPFDALGRRFFTMVYAVLDTETGLLRYANAGHPPPVLVRPGCAPSELPGGNLPIGISDDDQFEDFSVQLQPGDRVYAFSDGLTEAYNDRREMLQAEGLIQIIEDTLTGSLHEDLGSCIEKVKRWCGPVPYTDDISLLALEMPAAD